MKPPNAEGRRLVSCAPHPRSAQHLGWRPLISVSRGRRLSPHQHSLALKWALETTSWALGEGRLNASYQVLCSGYLTVSMRRTGKGQRSLWLWEGDQGSVATSALGAVSPLHSKSPALVGPALVPPPKPGHHCLVSSPSPQLV